MIQFYRPVDLVPAVRLVSLCFCYRKALQNRREATAARRADHLWQAHFNGRSGECLVLYQGTLAPSGYKSYCTACGQRNCRSTAENGNVCGRCHEPKRKDYPLPPMRVATYAGRDTDMYEDYADWELSRLRDRVKLVQEFDRLADAIVREAVYIAENYEVAEEHFTVEKTRQVLVPAA